MQGTQPLAKEQGALTMWELLSVSGVQRGQHAEVMRALSFSYYALNWLWAGDVPRTEGRENDLLLFDLCHCPIPEAWHQAWLPE